MAEVTLVVDGAETEPFYEHTRALVARRLASALVADSEGRMMIVKAQERPRMPVQGAIETIMAKMAAITPDA